MILQTRDQNILSSLSRFGILSSHQIGELFFKNIRHTTMMRRLRMLEKENFIVRAKGLPDSMSAWYLGRKGARAISCEEPVRYTNQNIILHEVNLSEVRLTLESIGLGNDFTSETELRRQYEWRRDDPANATRVIPDGIFVAGKNGKSFVVALEIEIQPKNWARLNKIFTEYAKMSAINRVFYVAGNPSIANLVIKEWKKVRHYDHSPSLFVCLLDELVRDKEKTRVYDYLGIQSPLSMIFDCEKPLLSAERQVERKTTQGVSGNAEEGLIKMAS